MSASTTVTVSPNLLSTLAPTGAIATIGSTIDPINGDQNPYGLVIAPATAGLITKGDLVVCNFNDATNNTTTPPSGNVQGTGTTIIGLHPVAGSEAGYRIAANRAGSARLQRARHAARRQHLGCRMDGKYESAGRCERYRHSALLERRLHRPLGRGFTLAATATQPAAISLIERTRRQPSPPGAPSTESPSMTMRKPR